MSEEQAVAMDTGGDQEAEGRDQPLDDTGFGLNSQGIPGENMSESGEGTFAKICFGNMYHADPQFPHTLKNNKNGNGKFQTGKTEFPVFTPCRNTGKTGNFIWLSLWELCDHIVRIKLLTLITYWKGEQ